MCIMKNGCDPTDYECIARTFNDISLICPNCNFGSEIEDLIVESESEKYEEALEMCETPKGATEIVLSEIKYLDFYNLEHYFEYENTSGEIISIDEEGVTHQGFTFRETKMPGEEGFDEFFGLAICVLRDNVKLLAQYLLKENSICSL